MSVTSCAAAWAIELIGRQLELHPDWSSILCEVSITMATFLD